MNEQVKKEMVAEAFKMLEYSYAPYSRFKVGAALLSANGMLYGGCNIENAAYGPSNCAERTAVFRAVACGDRILQPSVLSAERKAKSWISVRHVVSAGRCSGNSAIRIHSR